MISNLGWASLVLILVGAWRSSASWTPHTKGRCLLCVEGGTFCLVEPVAMRWVCSFLLSLASPACLISSPFSFQRMKKIHIYFAELRGKSSSSQWGPTRNWKVLEHFGPSLTNNALTGNRLRGFERSFLTDVKSQPSSAEMSHGLVAVLDGSPAQASRSRAAKEAFANICHNTPSQLAALLLPVSPKPTSRPPHSW